EETLTFGPTQPKEYGWSLTLYEVEGSDADRIARDAGNRQPRPRAATGLVVQRRRRPEPARLSGQDSRGARTAPSGGTAQRSQRPAADVHGRNSGAAEVRRSRVEAEIRQGWAAGSRGHRRLRTVSAALSESGQPPGAAVRRLQHRRDADPRHRGPRREVSRPEDGSRRWHGAPRAGGT